MRIFSGLCSSTRLLDKIIAASLRSYDKKDDAAVYNLCNFYVDSFLKFNGARSFQGYFNKFCAPVVYSMLLRGLKFQFGFLLRKMKVLISCSNNFRASNKTFMNIFLRRLYPYK